MSASQHTPTHTYAGQCQSSAQFNEREQNRCEKQCCRHRVVLILILDNNSSIFQILKHSFKLAVLLIMTFTLFTIILIINKYFNSTNIFLKCSIMNVINILAAP